MANPFAITPANPLQALMAFDQSYQGARKRTQEDELRAARTEAGNIYAQGGDTQGVLGKLIGLGDAQTVAALRKDSGATDDIKEYNLAKSQGFKGSFTDFKVAQTRPPVTNVNVNPGETAYDKTVGEGAGKRFLDIQKEGGTAGSQLTSLDVLERATQDPNFTSGIGAERFSLPLRQVNAAFGGDPKAAASMETFRAISSKAAIDSMGGSLGAGFSNADRDFVLSQVPSLANTPEGNKQLIVVNRKIAQRKQEIAKRARDYAKSHGGRIDAGFEDELATWANANPLFPQSAAPAAPTAPAGNIPPPPPGFVIQR